MDDYEALDLFGEWLMEHIRDRAIIDLDNLITNKNDRSPEIQMLLNSPEKDVRVKILELIPLAVDVTIHHLLWTLELDERIDVRVNIPPYVSPSLRDISDGLAGEVYGAEGWIKRFSKRRVFSPED